MPKGKEVVVGYQRTMGAGDWNAAGAHLADDLEFLGPGDTYHEAGPYVAALKRLSPMIAGVDVKPIFPEGTMSSFSATSDSSPRC